MRAALLVLLAGCGGTSSAGWVGAWSYDWALANHRVTALAGRPAGDGVEAAFVGGASTTNTVFDADGTCIVPTSCWELPGFDDGLVAFDRWDLTTEEVVLATGTATLRVDGLDVAGTVEVALPRAARGEAVAWIGGFAWTSTPGALDGSCYDPRHGWLPVRLAVAVGEVAVDGRTAIVPVTASFLAGASLESQRTCLDAVTGEAAMDLAIDVVVAVGTVPAATVTVAQGASWPTLGQDQLPEDAGTRDAGLGDGIVGWQRLDFAFHEEVEPGRGAYLRSVEVVADRDLGLAYGFATSTSFTQLAGFDFGFEGRLVTLDVPGATVRRFANDAQDALLDDDGAPVLQDVPPAE